MIIGRKKKQTTAVWILETHLFRADEYVCSACHHAAKETLPVCPVCGAVMRGLTEDPLWVDDLEELDAILDD